MSASVLLLAPPACRAAGEEVAQARTETFISCFSVPEHPAGVRAQGSPRLQRLSPGFAQGGAGRGLWEPLLNLCYHVEQESGVAGLGPGPAGGSPQACVI